MYEGVLLEKNKSIKVLFLVSGLILLIGLGMALCSFNFSKMPCEEKNDITYTTAQQQYVQHIQQSLQQLLEPLVGYGKVKATVSASFNLKNQRIVDHKIIPNSAIVSQETITRTQEIEQPYQIQRRFVFSTQDTESTEVLGKLEQQHISVVIDGNTRLGDNGIYQARSAQEMQYYTNLIKNAVGYNPERGDTLEVLNMPFVAKSYSVLPWENIAKILIIVSIFLFIVCFLILGLRQDKGNTPLNTKESGTSCLQFIQKAIEKDIQVPLAVIKNWIYMPEVKNNEWTGTQKVSILLLALGDKAVQQILSQLGDDEVRKITKTMASLGLITMKQAEQVFEQFVQAMQGKTNLIGNQARVHQILSNSLSQDLSPHTNPDLWRQLETMDNQFLADMLQGVSSEIAAFILYHQEADKAAQILAYLPTTSSARILTHLAHIGHVSLTTHYKLDKQAEDAVKSIIEQAQIQAGDKKASEILKRLSKVQETEVVSALYQKEPDLAKKITRHLIKFHDIMCWSDDDIRTLLRHISKKIAVLALVGESPEMLQCVARNVPPQTWAELQQQIQDKKDSPENDVEMAREKIIAVAQELLSQRQLHI